MGEPSKFGRYVLRRILGRGAMGVVYEGFDPSLNRAVAIKTILKSVVTDEETAASYSARFAREAKAAARLSHSNIVQVYDFGEQDEIAYLVMEFIQGRELRAAFEAGERFDSAQTVRIMVELLGALEFAHQAGVVHRDVKPANVMLDAQLRVKLADFGVARLQDGNDRSKGGTMVGTPAFMSPEQISGARVDRRTDVFSAGIVLYQLLTGEQPFKGEGAWTVAKQIMQDEPPRPSTVVERVPPAFDQIVNRALAKKPDQRYATAKEFAAALQGALVGGGATRGTDAEIEFWRSIQSSSDPAEFAVYLKEFPDGVYAELARIKMAKLPAASDLAPAASASDAELAEAKSRLEAEFAAKEAEYSKREAEAEARRAAETKAQEEAEAQREAEAKARAAAVETARLAAIEQARREAEAELAKREIEYRKREAEASARAAAEAKARAAAELRAKQEGEALAAKARAEVEAQAKKQAEEFAKAKAEAEARTKREATARARVEAETAAREAKLQKQLAAGPRRGISLLTIALAAAIFAGVIGAWYWRTTSEEARIAALSAALEAATRANEELSKAKQAALESQQRAADARATEAAAQKAGDAATLKAATDARLKAEADAAAQAKLVQQREADAKKADEAAKAADAKKHTEMVKAAEKAAQEKAAAEKAAVEKAAAEKATAERLAADKAAADKAAAEKAAAEKLAADKVAQKAGASRPTTRSAGASTSSLGLPKPGDRWVYSVRRADASSQVHEAALEVRSTTSSRISYAFRTEGGPEVVASQRSGAYSVTKYEPGVFLLSPYLLFYEKLQAGDLRGFDGNDTNCLSPGCVGRFFATVVEKERITVQAGVFETWKIAVTLNAGRGQSAYKIELSYWFDEATGVLTKYQRRIAESMYTGIEPEIDMELVKTEHAAAQRAAAPKLALPSVGDRWVYNVLNVDNGQRREAVLEVKAVDATGVSYGFRDTNTADPNRVQRSRARVLVYLAPGVILLSPYLLSYETLRPDTELSNLEIDPSINAFYSTFQFEKRVRKESVTVPAGTFEAWKVSVLQTQIQSPLRIEFTYWYAEDGGRLVKYQRRLKAQAANSFGYGATSPDIDMELLPK